MTSPGTTTNEPTGDSGQTAPDNAGQNGDGQQANAGAAVPVANGQQNNNTSEAKNDGQHPPKPSPPAKTFSQAELDRILNEQLGRQEKAIGAKLAEIFGGTRDGDDGKDAGRPDDVLKQVQATLDGVRNQANTATAEALARAAGIRDERLDTFIGLAMSDALKER